MKRWVKSFLILHALPLFKIVSPKPDLTLACKVANIPALDAAVFTTFITPSVLVKAFEEEIVKAEEQVPSALVVMDKGFD